MVLHTKQFRGIGFSPTIAGRRTDWYVCRWWRLCLSFHCWKCWCCLLYIETYVAAAGVRIESLRLSPAPPRPCPPPSPPSSSPQFSGGAVTIYYLCLYSFPYFYCYSSPPSKYLHVSYLCNYHFLLFLLLQLTARTGPRASMASAFLSSSSSSQFLLVSYYCFSSSSSSSFQLLASCQFSSSNSSSSSCSSLQLLASTSFSLSTS